ncbi:DNA-directed DNA polymerase [Tanacetum coccineum]
MLKYAKFLKGLLSNKTRLEEACTVTMNERCSAVLLNKLPSKEKDPGSFTIPCDIRHLHITNALADSGASISLMPYTMYEKLGLGEPKTTRMSLELADRYHNLDQSIKRPPAEDDKCSGIDYLDTTIHSKTQELLEDDQLDSFLVNNLEKSIDQFRFKKVLFSYSSIVPNENDPGVQKRERKLKRRRGSLAGVGGGRQRCVGTEGCRREQRLVRGLY